MQTVRVQLALQSVLHKAGVYELLATLQKCVDHVIEITPPSRPTVLPAEEPTKPSPPAAEGVEGGEGNDESQDGEENQEPQPRETEGEEEIECELEVSPVPVEVIKKIVSSLEELKKMIERSSEALAPPEKLLPYAVTQTSKQLSHENDEVYSGLVRMFRSR